MANKIRCERLFIITICFILVFSLSACKKLAKVGEDEENTISESIPQGTAGADVAFILPTDDASVIERSGWVQKAWEGVKSFCEGNGKSVTWYAPQSNTTQGFSDVIKTAASGGTGAIVSTGPGSVEALAKAQSEFQSVKFIAVEASGIQPLIEDNTYAIFHQVNEAGFLAGVAAVKGGFKNIGILTGYDTPEMNAWCYGYIQGINYAAGNEGISGISVKQKYVNSSVASPAIQELAASWYDDGCDLIIPLMDGGNLSLFAAADKANKPCFGSDVDQGALSEMVLTGAVRHIDKSVSSALKSAYAGDFPGGTYKWFTVTDAGVGLAEGNWRLDQFGYTLDSYKADLKAFTDNVNKQRSSLLVEAISRKDPGTNAFDALWNALEKKNIEFTAIK